jgi:hypothetical protein
MKRVRAWRLLRPSLRPAALATLLVALPMAADAQRPRRGSEQSRLELEQRVRARMARVIQQRLGLDEQQADTLSAVVADFDARRRELARQDLAIRRRVEALMLEGGENQTEARALLQRMADLRTEEAATFEAEQAGLLEILSPVQVLRLQALRAEVGRRIRALRGGRGGDRPPGPPER